MRGWHNDDVNLAWFGIQFVGIAALSIGRTMRCWINMMFPSQDAKEEKKEEDKDDLDAVVKDLEDQ